MATDSNRLGSNVLPGTNWEFKELYYRKQLGFIKIALLDVKLRIDKTCITEPNRGFFRLALVSVTEEL